MSSRIDRALERLLDELESGVAGLDRAAENTQEFYRSPEEAEESSAGWSILADKIVAAYRRGGFVSAIVYGRQGAGKSVYAIKVAYDALRRLGKVPRSARSEVVFKRYMVFSAHAFISKLRNASFSARIPVLIWDDAGVHGGSYLHFVDPHLAKAVGDVFRVARTRVAAILFTTPSPRDLLRPLRSYDTLIVYVHEVDDVWSRAHIYQLRLLPSGDARITKIAIEDFKRRLPTYSEYIKIRDRYADYAIDYLQRLLEEKSLKKAGQMREVRGVDVDGDEEV